MLMRRCIVCLFVFFLGLLVLPGQVMAKQEVVDVSTKEYNTIKFTEPFQKIVFPPDAEFDGDPISMSEQKVLLVKLTKDAKTKIQLIVQFQNGEVLTLYLRPNSHISGTESIIKVQSKEKREGGEIKSLEDGPTNFHVKQIVDIFKAFNQMNRRRGIEGFRPVPTPPAVEFTNFYARPVGAWGNEEYEMMVFSLIAKNGEKIVLSPSQFYRKGVIAVELAGGDIVDQDHSPELMLLIDRSAAK